ncbi:hypothetical protein K402DRAFT_352755 [Aulographum hederae CBS 113979]|uniref:Uncharacterized protein n=1 Tax=Aulographum hederae CBS 113979 TaxID=1176131 RepID=A0A6G1H4K2_9PEZI|nr:hypothetical protein K402DRAFT_352755 [Aulographum hederae CBS 113979]
MSDSPAVFNALPTEEQPILDKLYSIRSHLELLKQDRSQYVKSQDVINLYHETNEQVHKLNGLRQDKPLEQNRVDNVLDDCYQLISLSFMTIGKTQEAPAVYSAISTVKRLLDHLKECAFFLNKDLDSIADRLEASRHIIARGKNEHDPNLLTLLENRIDVCQTILSELQRFLGQLTPELLPTYEKLVSILRSLSACNTRSKFPTAEVNDFQKQLRQIAADLGKPVPADGGMTVLEQYTDKLKHMSIEENTESSGQKLVSDLLIRCLLWVEIIQKKDGKIDEHFKDTYDKLLAVRNKLEQLQLTQAWSLRETDLWSFQRQLDRIDESRVDGNFVCPNGKPADLHAQRTLLYLLRKSYAVIYQLLISSEPVSEALLPIHNQLKTLRRCLIEVKKAGGISSPRELYPYSMKLNSIDNMRKDGKFMIGDDIPDGQGAVTQLLSECFELAYELRTEAEENEERDDKEDDSAVDVKSARADEVDDAPEIKLTKTDKGAAEAPVPAADVDAQT